MYVGKDEAGVVRGIVVGWALVRERTWESNYHNSDFLMLPNILVVFIDWNLFR